MDREAATTLLALSALAANRVVNNPANAALPFVADYLVGRYKESYDAAREPASKSDASADAALLLAQMNFHGLGRPHDIDTAVTWIRTAAQAKSPDGALMLGFAYLYGLGISKNVAVAVEHLKIAERADQPIAAHLLGALHFSGKMVQQNYKTAFVFFDSGASRGFVPSKRALAVMSDQGLGTDPDPAKALTMAKAAADEGDSTALLLLGLIHADETGPNADTAQALGLLQKAAGTGASLPSAVLGVVYETGQLGVQRDRLKAIEHYSRAQGLASGQIELRLAELYLQGGAAGEARAVPLLRKAAEAGQIGAQIRLGEFYKAGFGLPTGGPAPVASEVDSDSYPVPRNLARAFGWFTLASRYASGPEQQAALTQVQEIGRDLSRSEWVAGTEFAVTRVRKRDGLLQDIAKTVPSGVITKAPSVPRSTGSGVVVGRAGHILTNAHVVKGCTHVSVTLDRRKTMARILHPGSETGVDLALLQLEYYPGIAAKFRSAPLRVETIVVMGFPMPAVLGEDSHLVTQPGPITSTNGAGDDTTRFQVSATINPGNSGGPLFDLNGNIAGIAVSRVDSKFLDNTYFAIKSSIARNFLESHQLTPEIGSTVEKLDVGMLEEQRRGYVAFVECFG